MISHTEMKGITSLIKKRAYAQIENNEINDDSMICEIIDREIFLASKEINLSISDRNAIKSRIFSSIRGYDLLDTYLADNEITEIIVNGPDNVFIERNGVLEKTAEVFEDEEKLMETVQRIAARANKNINTRSPILDTILEDGSRVCLVIPPVSRSGSLITIRKFSSKGYVLDNFVECGSMTREASDYLINMVRCRKNIFISGSTGSGKTSLLNALSNFIPENERVITIEDSAELNLSSVDDWVRLEARPANLQGKDEITIRKLIKTALRMRPDRIIVGEVRGEEAIDMLQAMNTGHAGSMSTGHANGAVDMLSRLETMVVYGAEIPLRAIRGQIASAIDVIIHLERDKKGKRQLGHICEIIGLSGDDITTKEVFIRNEKGDLIFTGNKI